MKAIDDAKVYRELQSALEMDTRPVGVKLYRPGDAVNGAARPEKPMTFCCFVREAANGHDFVVQNGDLSCRSAQLALGFRDPIFGNIAPRLQERIAAIRVGPLSDADVVLLVLNPEQMMTV